MLSFLALKHNLRLLAFSEVRLELEFVIFPGSDLCAPKAKVCPGEHHDADTNHSVDSPSVKVIGRGEWVQPHLVLEEYVVAVPDHDGTGQKEEKAEHRNNATKRAK